MTATPHDDIRTWLGERAGTTFAYLTTTGRRSSEPHRIEIWFGVDDDRVLLMSGGGDRSDWVKNLQANPAVTIEIDGESRAGQAEVIDGDSADDEIARETLVRKYQKTNELADWRRRSLPIRITFPPDTGN